MPEIYLDVDSALSEVPVNVMPLVDDTDFKSREIAIAYDASGMDLRWNFVTSAGAYTSTAVTPTSGGDYDWAHQGDGMYSIEIPASGGASINNDTEGYGWFSGVATGVLPWRGPVIGFRSSSLNNALMDGGAVLDTNTTQIGGSTQSLTDIKDFADTGYDPVNHRADSKVVLINADAVNASALATDAITEIQNGLATSANQTTILNRIGAITGSGVNTLLGFFKALLSKTATVPSDIGGAFDPATDSTEAIRDHGDSAWTTADVSSLATSTEVGSNKTILDKVDSAMVADGLVYKFTANALEESPAASGGLTVAQDAKLTTIYNEITTDSEITVTSPVVSSNGTITIVRGYDYKDADDRSIEFTSEIWPNLTSATVKMAQRDAARTNWSTMSVVTAGGTGVTQKVRLELEDTFTDDLSAGRLLLRICATLSNGDIVDLGEVAIEVK